MRFTSLLTLLAATSALSYTIKRDEIDDKLNQLNQALENNGGDMDKLSEILESNGTDINQLNQALENNGGALGGNNDLEKVADGLTDNKANSGNASNVDISSIGAMGDCLKASQEIVECLGGTSKQASQEEVCNTFNSEKCQSLLNKDFSSCGKDVGGAYDFSIATLKLGCAKDEKGNNCPQYDVLSTMSTNEELKFKDNEIQEICQSSVCTEKAIDAITQLKKSSDNVKGTFSEEGKANLDKYINDLNKCKASGSAKSDATQIKVGSALLASLALAFYLF